MAHTFRERAFANVCQGIDHLYSDGQFCDLVVTIDNDNFSCHRLVLAAVSGFFQSSLTSSWHESSTGFVNIDHEDVTGESFKLLLDIIYRGGNVISMDTVKDVLKLSIFLRVKFLEDYCEQYLSDNMAPDTYLGAWEFAEKYQLMILSDKAAKMAATHFDEVAKCEELLQLPKAKLLTLLSLQKKLTMDDVCRAIFRWAEEDVQERKCCLGELLPFVNFTLLTPACLNEFVKYLDHPFKEYIYRYISEGLTFHLQGLQSNNIHIQRQLRAQQGPCFTADMPGMTRCAVIVGGMQEKEEPLQDVAAVPIDAQSLYKVYQLKPLPEACGLDFATCVWRNELYISGGSMQPKYFAVYKPGDDVWEALSSLPQGREKHTMAAIDWTIYVLGGDSQRKEADKGISTVVLSYNTKDKVWKNFSSLRTAVKDATSATLGHRVYVFGGQDVDGHDADMVQCVDTLTGCVYTAGTLPSPKSGIRALSTGGAIFVISSEGDVLQMKEHFSLAEQHEKELADKKAKMISKPTCTREHGTSLPLAEKDIKSRETVNEDGESGGKTSSVRFKAVGTFPSRQHFGAFLLDESVVVCGGKSQGGELLNEMVAVSFSDGTAARKPWRLLRGMACFGLHVLNIPQEFLTKDKGTEQPREIGDKVKVTQAGINYYMGYNNYGGLFEDQDYDYNGYFQHAYHGPPQQSIGILTANVGNGSWTVDFPGYGVVNIPGNYFQREDDGDQFDDNI